MSEEEVMKHDGLECELCSVKNEYGESVALIIGFLLGTFFGVTVMFVAAVLLYG